MALAELLTGSSSADFLNDHFLKTPFARAGGCIQFAHLGDWLALDSILRQPEADVIIGRAGQQRLDPVARMEQARAVLAEGYTIGIRHAEKHHAGLAALARSFHRDFLAPINIHLYCTPAGHDGFGWHYDAEDVFILQTHGSKTWWLRKNTVNPWPLVETLPDNMRYEREITPSLQCELLKGDWLYIPGGYWHRTHAQEESISLSVGVLSPTAIDIFDFLRTRLLHSLRWRQRLPVFSGVEKETDAALERFVGLFAELAEDLERELRRPDLLRAFLQARRSASPTAADVTNTASSIPNESTRR